MVVVVGEAQHGIVVVVVTMVVVVVAVTAAVVKTVKLSLLS